MVTARRTAEGGMTLVEIMITMVISAIIAAATFMFFAGQQRIYETQTKVLNIQQNLWAAMEVVARNTRAAGAGMYGCVKPASFTDPATLNGSRILNAAPSPGPLTANLDTRPQTGARAYNDSTTTMQWIPPLWIVNNDPATSATDAALHVLAGTDVISVAFGNLTSGTDSDIALGADFTSTDDGDGNPIVLDGLNTGSMFLAGEFVLLLRSYSGDVSLDRGCSLFQVTRPLDTASLSHKRNGTDGSVWNPAIHIAGMLPSENYFGYARDAAGVRNFGTLNWVSFFIQRQSAGATPNLMMQPRHLGGAAGAAQVLAEGIEDLQVSFACDTGTPAGPDLTALNGILDEAADDDAHTNDNARRHDEWWNNVPGDVLPAAGTDGFCNSPTAVRLTLVARSLLPDDMIDPTSGNGPLDIEDHRQGSPRPTDSFRRRVLTTTVYPRNNKPQ